MQDVIVQHMQKLKKTNSFCNVLQASPLENFIENFNIALTQYIASLQCIVPVFMYLVGTTYQLFFPLFNQIFGKSHAGKCSFVLVCYLNLCLHTLLFSEQVLH